MTTNVLLLIESNTYFKELFRVAQILNRGQEFKPILLFTAIYDTRSRHVAMCQAENIICLNEVGGLFAITGASNQTVIKTDRGELLGFFKGVISGIIFRLLRVIKFFGLGVVSDFFYHYFRLVGRSRFATGLITRQNIGLLIVGGDLVHYDTSSYIKAGHAAGVPSIIVPCTMSNALEMAESYFNDPKYDGRRFFNRQFGKFFPHWRYHHRGKDLVRLPAGMALAKIAHRLAPSFPWINNSTAADYIATESETMVDYYTREGIPSAKIVVTGSPTHDILAQAQRQTDKTRAWLANEFGIPPEKPIILSPLPPDQHYLVGGRSHCDFSRYQDLVEYWVTSLARVSGYHVLINLHPSVDIKDYQRFVKDNVTIVDRDIAELIPVCKFFVASVSSVIRWAIICGKPVLNYDIYRFHYTDYADVPGIITVEERAAYEKILDQFAQDNDYYEQLREKQQTVARRWGVLDGENSARLLALMRRAVGTAALNIQP